MTKHTPGPWRAEGRDIRQGAENLIAQVARQVDNNGGHDVVRAANARLIAAAPEMAEMLEEVLADVEEVGEREMATKIRALLAWISG